MLLTTKQNKLELFQLSLTFTSKARAYPEEEHFSLDFKYIMIIMNDSCNINVS
jgi:hypothetical protein